MKVGVIISCLLSLTNSRYSRRVPTGHSNSPNALSLLDVIPSKSGNNVEIETEASTNVDICNELHEALEEGLFERADVLLAAGADAICFNDYDLPGPVLHSPTEYLSENADVCKALHDAVEEGHLANVESLLAVGVNANCLNEPPVLVSAVHSPDSDTKTDIAIVQLLLDQTGINVEAKTDEGDTALHIAALEGEVEIVKTLLDAGADVNSVGSVNDTSLMMAILSPYSDNKSDLIEILLMHPDIDVNATNVDGFTALHYATLAGDLEIVKTLLKAGIDVNGVDKYNNTALTMAVFGPLENGNDIVQVLLQQPNIDSSNLSENADVCKALHDAVEEGHLAKVESLLAVGVNANCLNEPPVLVSAVHSPDSDIAIVQLLLDQTGINVEAKTDEGDTALHIAAFEGEVEIVKTLLDAGADVNSVGSVNDTSLMMAILSPYSDNKSDLIEILLMHPDIDVNATNVIGFTALHAATLKGDLEIVKTLLKAGVDVNGVDNYNYTALMMAMLFPVENGIDIVEVLLQQPNIDVYVETVERNIALDFARRQLYAAARRQLYAADNKTAEMDNNMATSLLDASDNKTVEMDNNKVTSLLDAADN